MNAYVTEGTEAESQQSFLKSGAGVRMADNRTLNPTPAAEGALVVQVCMIDNALCIYDLSCFSQKLVIE